jgi:hypothetical protein
VQSAGDQNEINIWQLAVGWTKPPRPGAVEGACLTLSPLLHARIQRPLDGTLRLLAGRSLAESGRRLDHPVAAARDGRLSQPSCVEEETLPRQPSQFAEPMMPRTRLRPTHPGHMDAWNPDLGKLLYSTAIWRVPENASAASICPGSDRSRSTVLGNVSRRATLIPLKIRSKREANRELQG